MVDLLGEDQRSIWCGDVDATGRYVCRQVRDHGGEFHMSPNNSAGGIHYWRVSTGRRPENMPAAIPATNPAEDPIGVVRVHLDDDRMSPTARRRVAVDVSDYCGPYEGCRWQRLTGVGIHDGGCDPIHSDAVVGWPVQALAELAVVLGHRAPAATAGGDRLVEDLLGRVVTGWNDIEGLRKQLLDWADVLVRGGGMVVPADIVWKLRQLAGASSDSRPAEDTAPTEPEVPVVDGDLRARCITALSEQVSEFISPNEFGGYDPHYGELTDIVLAEVQPLLERQASEVAQLARELETSREQARTMASSSEQFFHQLHEVRGIIADHVGESMGPEVSTAQAVRSILTDLWEARQHLEEAGEEAQALADERDRLDAELKERPTAWAYQQANEALEKRRVALVEALGTPRPGQGFYDAVDDVSELVGELKQLRARPAIPADWGDQLAEVLGNHDEDPFELVAHLIKSWAPVSGSDTTTEDCDRCRTFPHELWCSQAPKGLTMGDLRELIVKAMDLDDVHESKIVAIAQPDGRYQAVADAGVRFARGQFVLALTPADQSRVSSGGDTTLAPASRKDTNHDR